MAADPPSGSAGGEHPKRVSLPVLVAASSDSDLHNAIGPPSAPLACWRFEDAHFAFDSAVINPSSRTEFGKFKTLFDKTNHPTLSLFGHADPVGDDDYNKTLSGRRAMSMYGIITRDVDLWEQLYTQPFSTDNWATNGALPLMRQETGEPDSTPRADLFRKYMDAVCQDAQGQPFTIEKTNFLGQGKDSGGKADYQGCSEFNPILLFSRSEHAELDKDHVERNRQNQPNRRVMIFMFPPGVSIDPAGWPCPRAKETSSGCRTHFWPDGDQRRAEGDERREYETDRRTFACAWYDALARRAPCEILRKKLTVRLFDCKHEAIPRARYRLSIGDIDQRTGDADDRGQLVEEDVLAPSEVHIEWDFPKDKNVTNANWTDDDSSYPFSLLLSLDVPTTEDRDEQNRKRLGNLGYNNEEMSHNIRAFQTAYDLTPVNGEMNEGDATENKLKEVHDQMLAKSELGANGGQSG